MKKKEIRDLLARHADALFLNEAATDDFLVEINENDDQVASLLSLAASLKEALVPVVQVPSYRRYWDAISEYPTQEVIIRQGRRIPILWLAIAIIGSLLSLVSIIIVVVRYFRLSQRRQPSQSFAS